VPFLSSVRSTFSAVGRFSLPPVKLGYGQSNPASSATAIKSAEPTSPDGVYWISAAWTGNVATQVYCDMTIDGGGWMLFGCKVSPSFVVMDNTTSSDYFTNRTADTKGKVPSTSYAKVLWRFNNKASRPAATIWTRASSSNTELGTWFTAPTFSNNPVTNGFQVSTNGSSFSTLNPPGGFHYYSSNGLSEDHGVGDKVLDLWNGQDGAGNNYFFNDTTASLGTKCIAGYCYESEPVLFMWK
jgi:hypothetical protein